MSQRTVKSIVITGASSGLGAALAQLYAHPGITLGLIARNESRLSRIADSCRQKGATVDIGNIDVTDEQAVKAWLERFDAAHPIDLVIANAGISAGVGGPENKETFEQTKQIFDININGVLNTIYPAMEKMKSRKSGHIAIVSSLAGFHGMQSAPAYSTSKAAVRVYGEALQGYLYPFNVNISVICPGFIRTPLTDVNKFPMPFLMEPDYAARVIKDNLDRRKYMIAFPWPMALAARLQNLVPARLLSKIYAKMPAKPAN